MKNFKLYCLILLLTISLCLSSSAIPVNNVGTQVQEDTLSQYNSSSSSIITEGFATLANRYVDNFRTCQPIRYYQTLDLFGLKINFEFDVKGWIGDKCSYFVTGNIDSIGNDIRESFKIKTSDEVIARFAPKVECGFSREQLNTIVDWFIETASEANSNEKAISNVLKSPLKKNIKSEASMSPMDEKVMAIFVEQHACTIPNQEELTQVMMDIMSREIEE